MTMILCRFLESLDEFIGIDGINYGPFSMGDISTIPKDHADIIIKHGKAELIIPNQIKSKSTDQINLREIIIDKRIEEKEDIKIELYNSELIDNSDRDELYRMINDIEKLGARIPKNIDVFGIIALRDLVKSYNTDEGLLREYNRPEPKIFLERHLTDTGNSERLVDRYGEIIRYCHNLKTWFLWNGSIWEPDTTKMLELATDTAKEIYNEAGLSYDSEKTAKWAITSESLVRRKAMIEGAVFHVEIAAEDMDDRPELFNCINGTFDLDKFEIKCFDKFDYLTKLSGVEFNIGAECPKWKEHLNLIFGYDEELVNAFQMVCGYSLLQYNPEQVIFILWGNGKNGKSETTKVLMKIFKDYSKNIEASTIMQSKYNDPSKARPDVIRLKGARFVTVTEPDQYDELSEPLIKSITGDSIITARPLYANPVDFKPGQKIFISTNHKPKIKGQDEGTWRRIWLFPFNVEIPADKRQADYGDYLFEKESSGIFNWMLEGLRRYNDKKILIQPEAVKDATQQYRRESNALGKFLDEMCKIDSGEEIDKTVFKNEYNAWCDGIGWKEISSTKINEIMRTMFNERKSGKVRYWVGLRMKYRNEIDEDSVKNKNDDS